MSENENGGAFLTDKRSRFLAGEDVFAGNKRAKQTRYNHRRKIREHSKAAVYDFQHLFKHIPQSELRDESAFAEGHTSDEGPIPRSLHSNRPFGRVPDHHVAKDGTAHEGEKVDPEQSPDSQHKVEQLLEEMNAPQKASPETQEALIDAVGFLCRAAEAGELQIDDLIERGVEQYYRQHDKKENRIADLTAEKESRWDQQIRSNFRKKSDPENDNPDLHDIPVDSITQMRYLQRIGELPE